MYTTYKLKATDLNEDFLQSVKILYHDKVVEIAICDSEEAEEDETAYLLSHPANRVNLLTVIRNVEQQHVVEVNLLDL